MGTYERHAFMRAENVSLKEIIYNSMLAAIARVNCEQKQSRRKSSAAFCNEN